MEVNPALYPLKPMEKAPTTRCFCSVITWSHLPYIRALCDSLRASGNAETLYALITDATPGQLPTSNEGLICLDLDSLSVQPPTASRHYFSAFELCNTLKPFLVAHLLEKAMNRVIYLDCDLLVTGSFEPVWRMMKDAPLLLTPHQLTPPPLDLPYINEIDIVDQGVFNGGFSAWRQCPESARLLTWMHTRFPIYGFNDRRHGMFVDQKLLPLLVEYYPSDVKIVRNLSLNIGFWNAHERAVYKDTAGRWMIDDKPVIFFHLSGYRTSQPGIPCTYMPSASNEVLNKRCPWYKEVIARYHDGVVRHEKGHPKIPYPYARYQGVRLTADFRRLLFNTGKLDRSSFAFWRIWVREHLRPVKHFFTRNIAKFSASARSH